MTSSRSQTAPSEAYQTAEVAYVDLDRRTVVTTAGEILPITTFFDMFGEEIDEPGHATACVAGREGWGWLSVEILPEDRSPVRLH